MPSLTAPTTAELEPELAALARYREQSVAWLDAEDDLSALAMLRARDEGFEPPLEEL